MAEPKEHLLHYRGLPSSQQCGHCRSAAADEAEIAELSTLLDEVRAFARRVPVETRRQLAYQLRKAKQEIT